MMGHHEPARGGRPLTTRETWTNRIVIGLAFALAVVLYGAAFGVF